MFPTEVNNSTVTVYSDIKEDEIPKNSKECLSGLKLLEHLDSIKENKKF
jgi:hypothetical protein